ncbi:hypothetical protein HDU76_013283 [Blyttiomyces sp. JEL0837]|nr:hypothetical protein HDU76_013283 [Blyttiomyces sp. JEL0837]
MQLITILATLIAAANALPSQPIASLGQPCGDLTTNAAICADNLICDGTGVNGDLPGVCRNPQVPFAQLGQSCGGFHVMARVCAPGHTCTHIDAGGASGVCAQPHQD